MERSVACALLLVAFLVGPAHRHTPLNAALVAASTALPVEATATTSTSAPGSSPSALTDGDVADARTGEQWQAADDDPAPWAQLGWSGAKEVASVQVYGPQQEPSDATSTSTPPLRGQLRFSDGSSVVVSGIAAGTGEATTIAFAPRMATSVRLVLTKAVPDAVVGVRELAVFTAGTTPPRWPVTGETYALTPPEADCTGSSAAVSPPRPHALTLACPTPGSAVNGTARIIVNAPAGTRVSATAWKPVARRPDSGRLVTVADATATSAGRAVLSFSTTSLPRGPLTVKVTQSSGDDRAAPVSVQLMNTRGPVAAGAAHAPAGMTLQWDDEFDHPLSVSATGRGATYAATKPAHTGGGSFGDAPFADPADGEQTVVTTGGYLRLRATTASGPTSTARGSVAPDRVAGIISSLHTDGSGFAAQYGYFEARMMGAPGTGTWPAFWALNSQSTTPDDATAGEADTVELYGHNPLGSCHSTHSYGVVDPSLGGTASCLAKNNFADWTMAWHTYGMRITPDGATFTIDGRTVATDRELGRSSEPFFWLADMALGGGYPVDLAATGQTSDLYIDWVRIYT